MEPKPEDKYAELLRTAQPAWQKDSKGIRGDVVVISNAKAQLVWESKTPYRRPNLELGSS